MYSAPIYAYAARRVGRQQADEIVAEVFAIAWRRSGDIPTSPLPWLYGVARKVISQQLRADERRLRLHVAMRRTGQGSPGDDWTGRVTAAFLRLDPDDQEVLLLVAWEGLSSSEAGKVLGISATAFRMRMTRARSRLRRAVEVEELVDRGL